MPSSDAVQGVTGSNPLSGWEAPVVGPVDNTKMDRDTFLKLLIAQVKNQNPAEPMNPNERMSQMAQLTTVDKLTQLLEATTSGNALGRIALAGSLIGRSVAWVDTASGTEYSGGVTNVRLDGEDLMLTVGEKEVKASEILRVW